MIDSGPALTKFNEGYRGSVYLDTAKVPIPTGGYGHAFLQKSSLPKEIWDQIFTYDYGNALSDYDKMSLNLDDVRKAVVVDILFARGLGHCLSIESAPFFAALRMRDWLSACNELEQWAWFKAVGTRGPRLQKLIKEGRWDVL
jgi:GH24 family phage-related lysozyme (muramidase)